MALTDPLNLILILGVVAVLLIWGPSKIPQLARSLGQARREFQKGSTEDPHAPGVTRDLRDGRADDDLLKVAQTLGISTEGKDRKQISDEVNARLKSQV
jgi:sec-independent protein translocase protein TatA